MTATTPDTPPARRRRHLAPVGPDQGDALEPAPPGPELATSRGSWCYATGDTPGTWPRGVYARERESQPWRMIAPLPHVLARVTRRNARGEPRWHEFILSTSPEGPGLLVDNDGLRTGTWAQRLGLVLSDDQRVMQAASSAIRAVAADAPQQELTARWVAGRLVLPPVETLPGGYLEVAGSEADARVAWAEVGRLACLPGAENLALNLGGAYAAPYPAALLARPESFALVGVGAPRRGKTTNANAAAGWWGSPILVNPVVSESSIALGEALADLGCLPLFRDEAHAAPWKPRDWHQHWMRTLNGAGRRRAGGGGGLSSVPAWWGVQWWTGNVDPRFGAVDGVQARVVVLSDPHQPDRETARRVTELVGQAHGWPVRWQLEDHPTPEAFAQLRTRARSELQAAEGSADTVADSLALAIAGAELAGQLIDAPGLRAAAIRAARRVLDTLIDTMADDPASFGDRLLSDVWADVQAHPGLYPTRDDYEAMYAPGVERPAARDVHGFRHEDQAGHPVVSLTRPAFRALTAEADYATSEALSELRDRGLLVHARDRYQHLVKINGRPDWFYTFRPAPEPEPGDDDAQGDALEPDPTPDGPLPLPLEPDPDTGPQGAPDAPAAPGPPAGPAEAATAPQGPVRGPVTRRRRAPGHRPGASVLAVGDGWVAAPAPDGGWARVGLDPADTGPALVARLDRAAAPGDLTVVIAAGRHTLYGLPETPGDSPADRVLLDALHAAGYHRPDHPDEAARSTSAPVVARVERPGTLRLVPASWLGPDDWPRVSTLDAGPEIPDVLELAGRLRAFHARTGWVLEGTVPATAVRVLRSMIEDTTPDHRRPTWQGGAPWAGAREQTPVVDAWVAWARPLDAAADDGALEVRHLDAVRNYLAAYRQASLARTELRHDPAPTFDERKAGLWEIVVPDWPHPLLPAPLPRAVPGSTVWTTTDRLRLYLDVGITPEIVQAWTADRWEGAGLREFTTQIRDVLAALAPSDDPTDRAVAAAVKHLYRSCHGNLRRDGQRVIARPDWGHAIRDAGWCSVVRRTYQAAGLLPLPGSTAEHRRYAETPRYPVAVNVDEVAYAGRPGDPLPAGLEIADRLGGFRETKTLTIDEWEATQ